MRGKSKQSDTSIVVMKRANKEGELSAESVERRDGAKGNSAHQSTDRTQSRITVTQAGVGYGGRRDLPSLPEVGAVCLNGHARICAGGAGQPVSLPRLLAAALPISIEQKRMGEGAHGGTEQWATGNRPSSPLRAGSLRGRNDRSEKVGNRGNMHRFYRFRSRSISAAQAPSWG